MDPSWLSNAYLVADRPGGTAVFVDSGAPLDPLLAAVDRLEVQVTHLESRTTFPVSVPAQRTAMVLLERKTGKLIGRM